MILTMNYLTLYDSAQYQLLKSAHLHKKADRPVSFFAETPLRFIEGAMIFIFWKFFVNCGFD